MNIKIWIKLVALLTALSATLVAIFWLKQDHISSFWTSLGMGSKSRINWCEERVDSIYFYDSKLKVFEKDGQWILKSQDEKIMDYLRVEKWFAKYCQIAIDAAVIEPSAEATPLFEAHFINGERLTLYAFPNDKFRMRDLIFKSETLRQAIKELLAFESKIE